MTVSSASARSAEKVGVRGDGPRHRDRHPAGPDRSAVPLVQSGRRLDEPPVRRDRPGSGHQPTARGADGRHRVGREHRRAGRGEHVPPDDRGRGHRHVPDRAPPGRVVRRASRARRGRQRHEPATHDRAARRLGDGRAGGAGRRFGAGDARGRCGRRRRARHADAGSGRVGRRRAPPRAVARRPRRDRVVGRAARDRVRSPMGRSRGRRVRDQADQGVAVAGGARVGARRPNWPIATRPPRARSIRSWAPSTRSASCWPRTTP